MTGLLPASPAFKDGIKGSYLKKTFSLPGSPALQSGELHKIPDGAEIEFFETDLPRIETEWVDAGKFNLRIHPESNLLMHIMLDVTNKEPYHNP